MAITAIFIFSSLAIAGTVSAAVSGTCQFNDNNQGYKLGDTMTISISGSGNTVTKNCFIFYLKNPSGKTIVQKTYYGNSFSAQVPYTLSSTDPTGTWTAKVTYKVFRGSETTLATDTAVVSAPPAVTWVLMAYLCGDNAHCDAGAIDIMNHIIAATHTSQVRTIAMIDPYDDWSNHPYWGTAPNANARYYELFQGNYNLLADVGEVSMGNSATLEDFITYSENLYPTASNYGLVLFDNGRSWKATCFDIYPDFDYLTAIEINTGLKAANVITNKALSLLGFDACNMQTSEIAFENRENARVMVASEELEWYGTPISDFDSWPWTAIITDLSSNFGKDALWLGSQIVSDFKAMWQSCPIADWHPTISAIDLSYMNDLLKNGISPLGTGLQNCIVDGFWSNINGVRGLMEQYVLDTVDGKYRTIDLYEFANKIGQDMGSIINQATKNAISYIKTNVAIGKMVINEWHRAVYKGDHNNSHGLGIYFPLKPNYYYFDSWKYTEYSGLLMSVGTTSGWYGFLKMFISSVWGDEFSDTNIDDWALRLSNGNTIKAEAGNLNLTRIAKDAFCDATHTFAKQTGHLVIAAKIVVNSSDPYKWVYFMATYQGGYVAYLVFRDGNLNFSDGHTIIEDYASKPAWYFITMELDLVNGKCNVEVLSPAPPKSNPDTIPCQITSYQGAPLIGGITHASVDSVMIINGNWPNNYITTWVDYVAVTY